MPVQTRSVHSPIEPKQDGLRILATRFRGRGLSPSRYDVWMPNLGPSEALLADFQSGAVTWPEFGHRYRQELRESGAIDDRNHTIKNHGQKFTLRLLQHLANAGPVTLLCHCDEQATHCHRHLLQRLLQTKIK